MPIDKTQANIIDDFIARYPEAVQEILQKIRSIIKETAPGAQEAIKYGIPTFVFHGNLVHFSAYQNHIGFYPAPTGIEQFKEELSPYLAGKGTIQFPLGQPIPYDLIRKIVEFRVNENLAKAQAKSKKKNKPGSAQ
jgi:uncharacterized protein YdhG (YjbR/CyaY superfamily)